MSKFSGLCKTWSGAQGRGTTFHHLWRHRFFALPHGPEDLQLFLIITLVWGSPTDTGHPSSGSGVSMNCPCNSLTPVSHPTPSSTYPPWHEWVGLDGYQWPLLCCQRGYKPGWWDCDSLLSGPQPQEGTNRVTLAHRSHKIHFFSFTRNQWRHVKQEVKHYTDIWPGVCSVNAGADSTLKCRQDSW